jgi:hypothetical protein
MNIMINLSCVCVSLFIERKSDLCFQLVSVPVAVAFVAAVHLAMDKAQRDCPTGFLASALLVAAVATHFLDPSAAAETVVVVVAVSGAPKYVDQV